MKKYKFRIRKVLENTVEIKEENHKKAIYELIKLLAFANKEIFENSEDSEIGFDISLEEIENLNNQKKIKTSKSVNAILSKINKEVEENKIYFDDEIEEMDNEIEDDLEREYVEIVCEKCGNCIRIDEDDLFSEY